MASQSTKLLHILLTAFNVDFGIADRTQILDPGYLGSRLDLFERYCCPAIAAQTDRDFVWLVCFDDQTPQPIRERLDRLAAAEPLLRLCYVPAVLDKKRFWSDLVQTEIDRTPNQYSHVITTNLDNDDGLHREFVERIKQLYTSSNSGLLSDSIFEFVNFPYGYMLRPDGLFLREFLASPFLSLIEPITMPLTCKCIPHQTLFDLSELGLPVRQVVAPPLWLQVVHGLNVVNNRDINSAPQPMAKLQPGFAVDSTDRSTRSLWRWAYDSFRHNEDGVPLGRRLRSVAMGIAPRLMGRYLSWQMARGSVPLLTGAAARSLCQSGASEFDGLWVDLRSKSLL